MVATATYNWGEDGAVTLVNCVAEVRGIDPIDLDPIQHTIDTDALDSLLAGNFRGSCTFTYAGCEVEVSGDGTIRVRELMAPER